MPRRLSVTVERFALAAEFTIARGSKTEAVVVVATLSEDGLSGRGECVPYARYGESVESVTEAMEAARSKVEAGLSREELRTAMPPGAARNALDCALWDLEAKTSGRAVADIVCPGPPRPLETMPPGAARNALDCALWDLEAKASGRAVADIVCPGPPRPLETAYTISLGTPEEMATATRAASGRGLLKIKVGGDGGDIERIRAVHAAARGARLILDANEGWTEANIREHMLAAAAAGAILVEQPLPAGQDRILSEIPHPVPVCADESLHQTSDLAGLVGRYDFVNVKLDKTGGLTEALHLLAEARGHGFGVMVGCMVSTSLAMAPAVLLGQQADLVDLDGPLLMKADRSHGLVYSLATVSPPSASLWG